MSAARQSPIYVGWDARDALAAEVCASSLRRRTARPIHMLKVRGLRPEYRVGEQRYDTQTKTPFSTDFSFGRFIVPAAARGRFPEAEWALFTDPDTLWRRSPDELFALADPCFAVMVVKHAHAPAEREKMGGLAQTRYRRKNWSSVCLWNLAHPANAAFAMTKPAREWSGQSLHGFEWLDDAEIGALPPEWNWLAPARAYDPNVTMRDGKLYRVTTMQSVERAVLPDPAVVHWTAGGPWLAAYEDAPFADEWRAECGDFWFEGRGA